jgi:broad specificity phosphatase PhoE
MIFIVRHGETGFNSPDTSKERVRGWLDVPLDDQGRGEAEKLGKWLEDKKITKIYADDLQRTVETGQIINKYLGVPLEATRALRPWNLGDLQGQVVDKVIPEMRRLSTNPDEPAKGGESFKVFAERYLTFLKKQMDKNRNFVLVAHYRNLKLAKDWIDDGMKEVNPVKAINGKLATGSILEIKPIGGKWEANYKSI